MVATAEAGPEAVGASVRANPPVATIQTAATAKAPPAITHPRRLAATGTAGGTLSPSCVISTGELDMRPPNGSGCGRGARMTSRGVVASGTRYRGARHLGQAVPSSPPVQSQRRQIRSPTSVKVSSADHAGTDRRVLRSESRAAVRRAARPLGAPSDPA